MSSIAAAKKRRAGIQSNVPETPQSSSRIPVSNSNGTNQSVSTGPLSIAQVFASIDKRLIHLETSLIEQKLSNPNTIQEEQEPESNTMFSEYIEEMNQKFDILAEEITNTKDLLLKLQTFTMEVNKILLDKVLYSTPITDNLVFDYSNPPLVNDDTKNVETIVESKMQQTSHHSKPVKERKTTTEKKNTTMTIDPSIMLKYNQDNIEQSSSST
jgi:hypothetical protein